MDDTERYSGSSHGILDGDYWNRLSLTTDGGRPRRPIKDLYTHASSAPGVAPQSKPLATSDAPERTSMAGRSKCREREAPSARGSQHKRKASPHVARREGTLKRAKIQGQQGKVRPSQPLCGSSKIKSNKSKPAALKHGKTSPKNEVASLPTLQKSKSVTGSIDRKTTKVVKKGLRFELLWDADQQWYKVEIRNLFAAQTGMCTVEYLNSDCFEKIDLRTAVARDARRHHRLVFVSKDGRTLSDSTSSRIPAPKSSKSTKGQRPVKSNATPEATKSVVRPSVSLKRSLKRTASSKQAKSSTKTPQANKLPGVTETPKATKTTTHAIKEPAHTNKTCEKPQAPAIIGATVNGSAMHTTTTLALTPEMRKQVGRRIRTAMRKQSKRTVVAGDIVWVKYARYSECVWPGRVKEVIVDTVEALLCRQQALERLSPTRATDDDIASEPVLCIEWYNHYTRDRRHGSGTDSVSNTTNDFLECELTPFTPEVFKDNWRKRSHIRVGSASHLGDRFNRAVFQALMDWEADQVLPLMHGRKTVTSGGQAGRTSQRHTHAKAQEMLTLSVNDLCYLLFPHGYDPKDFCDFYQQHTASDTLGDAAVHMATAIQNQWSCTSCSFLNECVTSSCAICGTPRSLNPNSNTSREGRANARKFKVHPDHQSPHPVPASTASSHQTTPTGSEMSVPDMGSERGASHANTQASLVNSTRKCRSGMHEQAQGARAVPHDGSADGGLRASASNGCSAERATLNGTSQGTASGSTTVIPTRPANGVTYGVGNGNGHAAAHNPVQSGAMHGAVTPTGNSGAARKSDSGLRQFEPTGFLGQGMSGSLTKGSVGQVFKAMDLGPGDRFLDLGSGVGHVTLQAALDMPSLEWSRGIEVIEEAWSVAWTNAKDLKAIHKCAMAPVYYHLADLQTMDVPDLPDFTHAYVFAAGMPPELQGHLCRLLCKHPGIVKAAIVIDGSLGRGKTSLSTLLLKSGCFHNTGKLSGCMRGSGSGKTVLLFEKIDGDKDLQCAT